MRRLRLAAAAALAAGCAVPLDGAPCHTDAQCPGGQYCTTAGRCAAGTPPGGPPVVTAVSASCDPAGCPRDAIVTIAARVEAARLASVEGWLVVDPGTERALTTPRVALERDPASGQYRGAVRLADIALGASTRPSLEPHVAVGDLSGQTVEGAPGAAIEATRVRFAPLDLGEPVSGATVDAAGRLLLGGASGAALVVTPDPAGGAPAVQKVPLGLPAVGAAPAAADAGAWFTSPSSASVALLGSDGAAHRLSCPTTGGAGLLAATAPLGGAWVFAPGAGGQAFAVSPDGCHASAIGIPLATPFLAAGGKLFAGTAASGQLGIARFTPDPATGALARDGWSASLRGGAYACDAVDAPLAYAGFALVVLCRNGQLWCVLPDADQDHAAVYLHTFPGAAAASPVVAASGDVVLAAGGVLHRYRALTTRDRTFAPPAGAVTSYLLAARDADGVTTYAVTDTGALWALDDDLAPAWSLQLGSAPLLAPTIAPAGPAPGAVPTLFVPDADGRLHGVAVDGALDDAAPWPKERHDAASRGDAGP